MKQHYPIAAICVLGTSLTACSDPIVGYWTGTSYSFEDESIDIPYSYEGVEVISAIDMEIDSNLAGTFSYEGYGNAYTDNITVTNDGDSKYSISLQDDDSSLSCTLAETTLTCDFDDSIITFEKGQ